MRNFSGQIVFRKKRAGVWFYYVETEDGTFEFTSSQKLSLGGWVRVVKGKLVEYLDDHLDVLKALNCVEDGAER